jgi:hypothetical protein
MENELSRVVDTLPGLVWTALPDKHVDFFSQRWCGVAKSCGRGCRLRSTLKTCLSCSNAGDPFWLLASQLKWKQSLQRFQGE